jgi:hypothetical protein
VSRFGIIPEQTTASHVVDSRQTSDNVHVVAVNRSTNSNLITQNKLTSSATAPKNNSCIICQQSHSLTQCDVVSLSVHDRWKLIKKKRVCHRCLEIGFWHRLSLCKLSSSRVIAQLKFRACRCRARRSGG